MATRKEGLTRTLALVRALAESVEGLSLDDMAVALAQGRRSAERTRDVIALHFDLEEIEDGKRKRFRINDSLRRHYVRPSAAELAALQAEVEARQRDISPRAQLLASLLIKVKGSFDDREKRRIDPDFSALSRLQRSLSTPGPRAIVPPTTLTTIAYAIMAGDCVEFGYCADGAAVPAWRQVVPYGLLHGSISYLVGKIPGDERPPVHFRLDRMTEVRTSNQLGAAPDDFDLDGWLAQSFGIWRDSSHSIVIRILSHAVAKARGWHFHSSQQCEEQPGGDLIVRFEAGGLREVADHLFTWAGDIEILSPEALRDVMRDRLALAAGCLDTSEPVVLTCRRE